MKAVQAELDVGEAFETVVLAHQHVLRGVAEFLADHRQGLVECLAGDGLEVRVDAHRREPERVLQLRGAPQPGKPGGVVRCHRLASREATPLRDKW